MAAANCGPTGMNYNRIYVGNLPAGALTSELNAIFSTYGNIVSIHLKNRRTRPPFAFVHFEKLRDAANAVGGLDGIIYRGSMLSVQFPLGKKEKSYSTPGRSTMTRQFVRYSQNRVYITGLPPNTSWQDLKDFLREAGTVYHVNTYPDGTGMADYARVSSLMYALRKLNRTRFWNHKGNSSIINVTLVHPENPLSHARGPPRYTPPRPSIPQTGSRTRFNQLR